MLWAYFDESGEHDAGGDLLAMTLGGCVAPSENWDRLADGWNGVLQRYELDCFHMADFEAYQGSFRGWRDRTEDRRDLLNSLLTLIVAEVPRMIGFVSYPPGGAKDFRGAYRNGVVGAITHFSRESLFEDADMALVFAKHPQYSRQKIEAHFGAIIEDDPKLKTCAIQEPIGIPPLQAADVVAYELSRHLRDGRPERYPFRILREGGIDIKLSWRPSKGVSE